MAQVEDYGFEVIEAIKDYYKNDEEIMVGCLVYMRHTLQDNKPLRWSLEEDITELGYCYECGEQLVTHTYMERHTELDGNPIEYVSETLCPRCDR